MSHARYLHCSANMLHCNKTTWVNGILGKNTGALAKHGMYIATRNFFSSNDRPAISSATTLLRACCRAMGRVVARVG